MKKETLVQLDILRGLCDELRGDWQNDSPWTPDAMVDFFSVFRDTITSVIEDMGEQ